MKSPKFLSEIFSKARHAYHALPFSTRKPFARKLSQIDLDRYLGRWFVIASRPTIFEVDAYNATETYSWNQQDEKIDVEFSYQRGSFHGPRRTIPQMAWVPEAQHNTDWKISFWWLPFNFDYVILDVDDDYQWAAVGLPSQRYLWIMARTPQMDDALLSEILKRIKAMGYRLDKVKRVPQDALQAANSQNIAS